MNIFECLNANTAACSEVLKSLKPRCIAFVSITYKEDSSSLNNDLSPTSISDLEQSQANAFISATSQISDDTNEQYISENVFSKATASYQESSEYKNAGYEEQQSQIGNAFSDASYNSNENNASSESTWQEQGSSESRSK